MSNTTPALPFAPLTHHELNQRVQQALGVVAWYAAAALRGGGNFNESDVDYLREHATVADALQAAAEARLG